MYFAITLHCLHDTFSLPGFEEHSDSLLVSENVEENKFLARLSDVNNHTLNLGGGAHALERNELHLLSDFRRSPHNLSSI